MEHNICNMIVYEPTGCAHRHSDEIIEILKELFLQMLLATFQEIQSQIYLNY